MFLDVQGVTAHVYVHYTFQNVLFYWPVLCIYYKMSFNTALSVEHLKDISWGFILEEVAKRISLL